MIPHALEPIVDFMRVVAPLGWKIRREGRFGRKNINHITAPEGYTLGDAPFAAVMFLHQFTRRRVAARGRYIKSVSPGLAKGPTRTRNGQIHFRVPSGWKLLLRSEPMTNVLKRIDNGNT